MAKFDHALRTSSQAAVLGAVSGPAHPVGRTHEGGAGYGRNLKGELFLLAVTNFGAEDTFYEDAAGRDTRYRDLVRAAAVQDPEWTFRMQRWLRRDANMRSAAIVGGVEAGRALSREHIPGYVGIKGFTPRRILDAVLNRADEPGEALAYWYANYGRTLPQWFKRGLGDAALRLYNQYSYLKYDSPRNTVRFADVIEVSRINRARGDETGLFTYILDDRPGAHRAPRVADASELPMLTVRNMVLSVPVEQRRELLLYGEDFQRQMRAAGMTFEAVSGWLQGRMDAPVWERIISMDLMPYGALIKNLGNFERAQISAEARALVVGRLTNPDLVARSRLLPMAFLNAYNNVPGDMFKHAIDEAATLALSNVPRLTGRTLILIDTSGSMNNPFTQGPKRRRRPEAEQLMRWDAAALFGIAVARAAEHATVVSFSDTYWGTTGSKLFTLRPGENLLASVARFRNTYFIGGGTDTAGAVRQWYAQHDRVICLTDEQATRDGPGVFSVVSADTPVFTFNLAGYQHGHAATGPNRYVVGGLSDAGFKMMTALEAPKSGWWPWEG